MAQRFGGKFSPNGEGQTPPQPAATPPQSRDGFRTWVLFFLPLIFAVKAFQGPPAGMVFGLVACGLMIAAAWLTQQGLAAEQAYGARKVAKRPAFPRKIFGAVLMAAGLVAGPGGRARRWVAFGGTAFGGAIVSAGPAMTGGHDGP